MVAQPFFFSNISGKFNLHTIMFILTPSSHTYKILLVHQGKYAMKTYYDMIQVPK